MSSDNKQNDNPRGSREVPENLAQQGFKEASEAPLQVSSQENLPTTSDEPGTLDSAAPQRSAAGLPLAKDWKASIIAVWSGQAVSFMSSGAAGFALIWYLTVTTGSPLILSLATVIYFLPVIFLGPLAGTFVDRHNRKYIMIIADIGIALMSLITGAIIFAGFGSVPLVLVMIGVRSIGTTFHGPAMMAAMPLLVPERHLVRISTLDQGLQGLSNIGAPALGILIYTTLGLPAALVLDAVGAIIACVVLAFVKIPDVHLEKEEQTSVMSEMRDGFAAIRARHGMLPFFIIVFICTAAFYADVCFVSSYDYRALWR